MTRRFLPVLLCAFLAMSGCGKVPAEVSTETGADETALFPIDEWEEKWEAKYGKDEFSNDKFDKSHYTKEVVESKVDEAVSKSSSLAEEMKEIENVAHSFTSYHNEDLGQQDMNALSFAELYTWEYEMNGLLDRISEDADPDKKDSIEIEQNKWIDDFDRCFEAFQWDDGSWASMINSQIQARFNKNRCIVLAKELAEIRGESFELPERFFKDNSYVSEDAALDISSGMENGSISITYAPIDKNKIELLAYDPLINENTISFETGYVFVFGTDGEKNEGGTTVAGKITYGWDGAVLSITESDNKDLPAGTEISFPKAL